MLIINKDQIKSLQRQCSHIKGAIGNAADISNKLNNRIAFLFILFYL